MWLPRLAPLVLLLPAGCALSHARSEDGHPSGMASSSTLVVDEGGLHWLDLSRGAIVHAERGPDASMTESIVTDAVPTPDGSELVARSARGVAWVDARDLVHLRHVELATGASARISAWSGGPIAVAAAGDHVLQVHPITRGFEVEDLDLATGRITQFDAGSEAFHAAIVDGARLVAGRCGPSGLVALAPSGVEALVGERTGCVRAVANDGGDLYFAEQTGEGARVLRAEGGSVLHVADVDRPVFAVDGGEVVAVIDGELTLVRGRERIALAPADDVRGIALDRGFVYFTVREARATHVHVVPRP